MKNLSSALLSLLFASLCGCAHQQFVTDATHPEIAVSETGIVTYRGEQVDPEELPDLLKESGLTRDHTIHIHIVSGLDNYRYPYYVLGILVKNGFTRSVFVEDRKAYSEVLKPNSKTPRSTTPSAKPPIRYR